MWLFPETSDRKWELHMSKRQNLLALKKETLSHSVATTWTEKTYFSPAGGGEKPCVCLVTCWLTLPPVVVVSINCSQY